MKVLMFGWEFPPHISGGLGTACYGLTQSLLKHQTKILFVVPRVYGDENEKNILLINASAVRLAEKNGTALSQQPNGRSHTAAAASTQIHTHSFVTTRYGMTYIEVPAGISPYESPTSKKLDTYTSHVTSWNYAMTSFMKGGAKQQDDVFLGGGFYDDKLDDDYYMFSGTYGCNLLEEVQRYAAVGGIIARKYSFDVIHAHDWMTFPAGINAKRIKKKPLVVHVHSTEFDRAGENINESVFEIEQLGFAAADQIVAVSNWTKEIVVRRYNIPEAKIKVIHNGIIPKEPAAEFAFPAFGSHFVTFLGRVTHQKGPRFFVEAAHKVLKEFPDAHFIVAGAGDLLPQMIERVAQLNMSSRFHFTGFLTGDQVDRIWSLTDVYVMPSVSEPFGIAPLEAIQGGVPVILSNQSGVSEVMPHAIKVDFWDVKALAAAICSVLRYESLSQVLKQNSKRHIERLTWDKAASNVNTLYHELTTTRKR
jgi:glycogen(starch) synthase